MNGDGTIGAPAPTVIESNGSMSLLTDGTNYLLKPNGGATVLLSYGGSPVTVGQFGGWTPVAATQTATGYEVALKLAGSDQFTMWNLDSNGNYLSSAFNTALGSSAQLESYEPGFQRRFERRRDDWHSRRLPDGDRVVRHDQPADGRDGLFS